MTDLRPTYLTGAVMIVCVVERGRADAVIKAALEAGCIGAAVSSAHGVGPRERLGILGIVIEAEKDVVTTIAPTEQEEFVVQHLYATVGLDRPGGGMIYAIPLERFATYIPEDMRRRLEGKPG